MKWCKLIMKIHQAPRLEYRIIIIEKRRFWMEKQPMEIVQENKKGANGTQIAQQNNYYGMTYSETKALCLDLIKSELDIYKGEAEITAKQRDEQLLLSVRSELEI